MQASISRSAIEKVEKAQPEEPVKLLLRLSDLLLTDNEKEFVRQLGGTVVVDSARLAVVAIPSRHLVTLAKHLPSLMEIE